MDFKNFDFKRFLKAVIPYQKGLWAALFCSILGAAIETSIPAMLKPLLDSAAPADDSILATAPWWLVPFAIVILFSFRAIINYASIYSMTWSTTNIVSDIRNVLFHKILYIDPPLFEQQPSSKLINTITLETQNAVNAMVGAVQSLVKEGLTLLGLLGVMFWLNWKLTLIVFAVIPAVALSLKFVRKRLDSAVRSSQKGMDDLTYAVEENVLAYRIVRLHGIQPQQDARFQEANTFLKSMIMKITAAGNLLTPFTQTFAAIAIAIIVGIALSDTREGALTLGGFGAYIGAMLAIVPRAKSLSDVYPTIQRGMLAMVRIYNLLDEPLEEDKGTYTMDRATGHIKIENLTKIYPQSDRPALDNISFEIKAGETIALVGHSGSGKTTMVNMLPRFIEPTTGTIYLDGTPIEEWSLESLRQQMSMVSQDVVLFNSSIAENVALVENKDAIDREKVKEALSMAHLMSFIETLPAGIDTEIGHNGHKLSGGQRQRLAIARALYRNAPILILDEATSALDSESERLVQLALESLTHERTTLIVAHRLSTIRNANRIIVLDNGHIIESGTYEALISKDGAFARLVEAQAAMLTITN